MYKFNNLRVLYDTLQDITDFKNTTVAHYCSAFGCDFLGRLDRRVTCLQALHKGSTARLGSISFPRNVQPVLADGLVTYLILCTVNCYMTGQYKPVIMLTDRHRRRCDLEKFILCEIGGASTQLFKQIMHNT